MTPNTIFCPDVGRVVPLVFPPFSRPEPRITAPNVPMAPGRLPVMSVNGEAPDGTGDVRLRMMSEDDVRGLARDEAAGKADKAIPSADGNFASLDASGNLADSGKKASDFAPASHVSDLSVHHTVQGIQNLVAGEVAHIVAGAPDNLDTLKEIADVIGTESGSGAGGILKRVADLETGKASKSEMLVTPGTGADADKTTIQLKSGTSATVLTAHQDISGKLDGAAAYPEWDHSISYEYPDIVSYGGRLWRAISGPNGYPGLYDGEWEEVFLKDLKRGMDDLAYCANDWFVTGGTISRLLLRKVADGQWAGTQDNVQWGLMRIAGEWYFGKTADTSYGGRSDASADATSLSINIGGTAYLLTKGDRLALVSEIDISGKASKSEMFVTPGTGADADKTTIQLKSGTSATVLTAHQDVSGKANAADVATAFAQKAALTDLPYAMVAPGEWTFKDSFGDILNDGYYILDVEGSDPSVRIYRLMRDGEEEDSTEQPVSALTLDFGSVIATRPSLPGHLCDRAGNRVVVSGDTPLTLPEIAHAGRLRDFLVRLEISGSTVPTITFAAPTGETITYETDGDEFPVPDEAGNWVYSFTENCAAHKFAVSLKKVNTVTQGGA